MSELGPRLEAALRRLQRLGNQLQAMLLVLHEASALLAEASEELRSLCEEAAQLAKVREEGR